MKPKHLLVVTIDSLRADHLSCYGRSPVATPTLDAFAASGSRFEEHLTSLSTTLASHASLFTGCTPSLHGVNWNSVTTGRRRRTLPEIAAAGGYATSAITSWGGFCCQQVYGFRTWHSEGGAAADVNRGDLTLDRVLDWLERAEASTPQLLWVHFIDPHTPDNCPPPYPQTYQGEVAYVDMLLGLMLGAWDAKFGAENSLTVVTADHGEHLNDHGVERGHGTLWPATLHVPLMIRLPGTIDPGAVVNELTRQIDVLPTILDYASLPMPYDVEGLSLRGLIEGRDHTLRLVHQGQVIYDDIYITTLRNADYAFHFGDGRDLGHVFDRRRDPQETEDKLQGGIVIRESVQHSLADGQDTRDR